ncbi:MAG: hypothetical protein KGI09_01630 [Thaumarchaeota archaeon]|nr:hypothetical protein [Nitrososphaerota archaeon]
MRKFSEPEASFHFDNIPAVLNGKTSNMINFWKWAYSDLSQNVTRGMLGQYIVAWSLGVDDIPDDRWASFDLSINDKRIEVKTTSYLQAWKRKKINPQFTIHKTHSYSREPGYSKESDFQADVYILCYFFERDEKIADTTNLNQWKFWVLSRNTIEELFRNRRAITTSRLEKEFNSVVADDLKKTILSCEN